MPPVTILATLPDDDGQHNSKWMVIDREWSSKALKKWNGQLQVSKLSYY